MSEKQTIIYFTSCRYNCRDLRALKPTRLLGLLEMDSRSDTISVECKSKKQNKKKHEWKVSNKSLNCVCLLDETFMQLQLQHNQSGKWCLKPKDYTQFWAQKCIWIISKHIIKFLHTSCLREQLLKLNFNETGLKKTLLLRLMCCKINAQTHILLTFLFSGNNVTMLKRNACCPIFRHLPLADVKGKRNTQKPQSTVCKWHSN